MAGLQMELRAEDLRSDGQMKYSVQEHVALLITDAKMHIFQ
jgi:hypothetical protein